MWAEPGGAGGYRPMSRQQEEGCAFILAGGAGEPRPRCGAERQRGSPYCAAHHALCHLPGGSRAEGRQALRHEALAAAVGGRLGRERREPPAPLLRRLAHAARAASRAKRS